jgi:hypothetical protein
MIRSAASKVMWVGRATVFMVGLAVILALVFGLASAAFGANGQAWILGQGNVATAITRLAGPEGVQGAMLQVVNNNAGTDDTALNLSVQSGEAPMRVNSGVKVANLNADRIDDLNSSDFQRRVSGECAVGSSIRSIDENGLVSCEQDDDLSGDAAGGDLTGTYPNPAIDNNAVDSDKVANGSLVLADLQGVGTSAGGNFNFTVPAKGCDAPFDTGIGTASPFQVGDLVVWKVTQGTLPDGVYMPAVSVTRADRIPQLFCNVTASDISVSGSFTFAVRAVR